MLVVYIICYYLLYNFYTVYYKQSEARKKEKEYAAQPQRIGLILFPDLFKSSGFFINEDALHNLSPCSLNYHYFISGYLKNNERTV